MSLAERAELVARLSLKDDFSGKIRGASGALGGFESRLGRIGGIARQGVGTAIRNLERLGLVAGGLLASQVYAGVRSLEELQRATYATEGVIKSTGGVAGVTAEQVRRLAERLEDVTTADDKVIQSGENLLLTFTNIGKDVFPLATKAMVDLGIALAQGDVANADFKNSALQIGKALQDPVRGLLALRRSGVSFTKDQEALIKKLVKSGDLLGAQKIILAELEKEFGKAGEAAGQGFGADMRRFQDAVEGAQQALATGFLPLISEVARTLQTELAKPETLAKIREFGQGLAGGFRDLLDAAKKIPWSAVGDAMKLAGSGAKAIFDAFTALPPWVQTAVISGWGLNKLTGGALGGIVGELGKGLIRGVLGMNAGVVNINAGVVNGAGGAAGAAGAAGGLASRLKWLGGVVISAAVLTEALVWVQDNVNMPKLQEQAGRNITGTEAIIASGDSAKIAAALAGIQSSVESLNPLQRALYDLNANGVKVHTEGLEAALSAALIASSSKRQIATGGVVSADMLERQQDALREIRDANDAVYDKVEANRLTIGGKTDVQTSAIRSGDSAIVSAIRNLRLSNTFNLTIPLFGTVRLQTGTSLSRTQPTHDLI